MNMLSGDGQKTKVDNCQQQDKIISIKETKNKAANFKDSNEPASICSSKEASIEKHSFASLVPNPEWRVGSFGASSLKPFIKIMRHKFGTCEIKLKC